MLLPHCCQHSCWWHFPMHALLPGMQHRPMRCAFWVVQLSNRMSQCCTALGHAFPAAAQCTPPVAHESWTIVLQDSIVALDRVVPPLKYMTQKELHDLAEQPMIPLNVDGDRQYLISLRHGILVDKQRLFQILKGDINKDNRYKCKATIHSTCAQHSAMLLWSHSHAHGQGALHVLCQGKRFVAIHLIVACVM